MEHNCLRDDLLVNAKGKTDSETCWWFLARKGAVMTVNSTRQALLEPNVPWYRHSNNKRYNTQSQRYSSFKIELNHQMWWDMPLIPAYGDRGRQISFHSPPCSSSYPWTCFVFWGPDWTLTQRSTCLCLQRARIKGVRYQAQFQGRFLWVWGQHGLHREFQNRQG